MHPGRHIALCDSGTPAPHRLGACAQSPLHYHTPDCRGSASYCGRFESITLSFSPETLALWVPDISAVIKNKIDSHCCCQQQRCNAETHLTAQALRHALMRMHGGFSHEQSRRRYGCRGKVWSCSVWCWMNIAKTPVASPATSTRWNARNCCGRRICCWLI
ncbi:AraC family transcriptional regulator [Escherichia coli]|uniref:AraC family transcriptional regulator n=1 Tax=Escherichia coli TaxID=562 RepID=A0A376P7Q1_ECOLX|nr:AraC family transcriptional regulator [Escherichia coli]